jgi:hypothetical protein
VEGVGESRASRAEQLSPIGRPIFFDPELAASVAASLVLLLELVSLRHKLMVTLGMTSVGGGTVERKQPRSQTKLEP